MSQVSLIYGRALEAYLAGDLDDCSEHIRKIPAHERNLKCLELLGRCYVENDQFGEAEEHYRDWLGADKTNPIAQHMLRALGITQAPMDRGDSQFIAEIGNILAEQFKALAEARSYNIPNLIRRLWEDYVGTKDVTSTLHAGCGVGLCTRILPRVASLVGVDLSPRMIEAARERKRYHKLVVGEFVEFMSRHKNSFDVVLAADSLHFLGDLTEFIENAFSALKKDGVLLFSVDEGPLGSDTYELLANGRFVHSPQYIMETLGAQGIAGGSIRRAKVRVEKNTAIHGLLIGVEKP